MEKKYSFAGQHQTVKDFATYQQMYQQSIDEPEKFWGEVGKRLDWIKPYTRVHSADFEGDISIKWFEDGVLNACYNCVDRHLPEKANDVAITWEADGPELDKKITYQELYNAVTKFANGLRELGVKRGDRVIIYMPMVVEAAYAMLACARIGAVHSVVFGGFSADSLASRIEDCDAHFVITANEGLRGAKRISLKDSVDKAIEKAGIVEKVVVVKVTDGPCQLNKCDILYDDLVANQSTDSPIEPMNAEDPLFILYTSGSTGKPKGVLHTTGGYLAYAAYTHEVVFDYRPGDVYWCTADVGWITGHTYIVYGPLANGANTVMFEGVPTYPTPARFWDVCEKHKVNIFYTAPTALRSLMTEGDEYVKNHDLSSLRIIGSVGEPINQEAWEWYHENVGNESCPIVDTWWQTETGGHMITPIPYLWDLLPGKATLPFFGVKPELLDDKGNVITEANVEGNLVFKQSWPGQMRSVYGDHQRFKETYFSTFKGAYFSGDGAVRDEDGYIRITGRVDDILNISGHRMGTAEIEDVIDLHPDISEAAVVGFPHDIKGQGIYVFITLYKGHDENKDISKELVQLVREKIGPVATPDKIHISEGLPRTRSGKIMRRILRKIAENDIDNIGDISTLSNPDVVKKLIDTRQ